MKLSRIVFRELLYVLTASFLPAAAAAGPETTITNLDVIAIKTAIQSGGTVRLAFDGIVPLSEPFVIQQNVTIDGTGRRITFDGGRAVRHFVVTNGASLTLRNLQLVYGRFVGANGPTDQPGDPAQGGSIYCVGGAVELAGCSFMGNVVLGGRGGVTVPPFSYTGVTVGGPGLGGAIYVTNGTFRADNCLFVLNRAVGGLGNTVTVFTAPGGAAYGGAVYLASSLSSFNGVTFATNSVQGGEVSGGGSAVGSGGQSFGGALFELNATNSLQRCEFVANRAEGTEAVFSASGEGSGNGGAIFHQGGPLRIESTTFRENQALGGWGNSRAFLEASGGNGGALYAFAGEVQVINSAFITNLVKGGLGKAGFATPGRAGDGLGGAIYNWADLQLINCSLVRNQAQGGDATDSLQPGFAIGGGLFSYGGAVSLVNITAADNSAVTGTNSRLYGMAQGPGASLAVRAGVLTITNSILLCSASQTNVFGAVQDGGHNISSDGSAGFTAASSRNNLDPLLGALGYYGGLTPTVPLLPASPAIDAGDDSAAPSADQRGVLRPKGKAGDIGAFELGPTIRLTPAQSGLMAVVYAFQANRTNIVSASTDFATWKVLGAKVTNPEGCVQIDEVDPSAVPMKMYRVRE